MRIFKTYNHSFEIEEFQATAETDKYYTIIGWSGKLRRVAKQSSYDMFHSSRNEAENYLLNRIDRDIKYALEKIETLKKEREKLISGKPC